MELEAVPLASLHPHPRNPRRGNVAVIAASLRRFGQTKPIVVATDGTILAGTHTWLAAADVGLAEVTVVRLPLDPGSDAALAVVRDDNETADAAGYDERYLFETLAGLTDLGGTGFALDDVDDLRILYGEPDDDLPADPSPDDARRVMILQLPVPVFLWMQEALARLAVRYGVDSNTAAILHAVAARSGEPLPAGLDVEVPV
jgi:hypothetical protein